MARVTGLEPATSGVTGQHSNQLSYTRNPKQILITDRYIIKFCCTSINKLIFPNKHKREFFRQFVGYSYR